MAASFDENDVAQEEIHQAIVRLPKRQRDALELLEFERLSYGEIAASLGTSYGSVAQLISRARINLYDELRGTPLASIAAPSPECERSLPLIAAREDGQLDPASSGDSAWLDAHLAGCDRCRPAIEQMAAAAAFYRGWTTPADAAGPGASEPGARRRRRTTVLVATSVAVVLLAGLAAAFVGEGGAPEPADSATAPSASGGEGLSRARIADSGGGKGDARKKPKRAAREAEAAGQATAGGATSAEVAAPPSVADPEPPVAGGGAPSEHTSSPNQSSGKTAINPPKQVSTPKPNSKPKPAPTPQVSPPAPEPSSAPPSPEASPPAEEAPDKPGRSGEAPGKPTDRPSR